MKKKSKRKESYSFEKKKIEQRLKDLEKKYQNNLFSETKMPEIKPKEQASETKFQNKEKIEKSSKKEKKKRLKKATKSEKKEQEKERIKKAEKIEDEILKDLKQENDNRPSKKEVKECAEKIRKIKNEMSKALIGQKEIVDALIRGVLCDGHVLVEGVPGIAKTLAIRALGAASGCQVNRIQFTVDLLPTDIIGITSYTPQKGFEVIKGPIFANFLIADEINRSPSKTQSALIEGMQEKQVTIGKKDYKLPKPFFVMATENPLESAGVYPLPEAQIDRFLFKLIMGYPKEKEELKIMAENMTLKDFEDFKLKKVISPKNIIEMQKITQKIFLNEKVRRYIVTLVRKTRKKDFTNAEYISYGVSPRASIALFIASKARALMEERNFVMPEDVKEVIYDVLRHRLILSYKATLKNISSDDIITSLLNETPVI